MFDKPDVATVKVTVHGPWAVGIAAMERGRALLAGEIARAVPVIMRGIGNRDGYNAQYRVTVEVVSDEQPG